MTQVSIPGFPRIGVKRELKRALESHWRGDTNADALLAEARRLRGEHWQMVSDAGADTVPVNDFSLYDHVLDTAVLFDAIPERYRELYGRDELSGYFAMARGQHGSGHDLRALEMTKWFDTNYHYIVPELHAGQTLALRGSKPLDELAEAKAAGHEGRPVLLGPVSFLLLSKTTDESDTLQLLDALLPAYTELLGKLADAGASWVQLDEPMLALDLSKNAQSALRKAYSKFAAVKSPKIMLANYFGSFGDNLELLPALGVDGVHADLVRGRGELDKLLSALPNDAILSAGVLDGRNVWRSNPGRVQPLLDQARDKLGSERLQVATSCSLLHVPMDLSTETELDGTLRSWLSFARQKVEELRVYADAVDANEEASAALKAQQTLLDNRKDAPGVTRDAVQQRLQNLPSDASMRGSDYATRHKAQQKAHGLPLLPTTTIGSFPQTKEVRKARADHRKGEMDDKAYNEFLAEEIKQTIAYQDKIGLDVLVHGEPERNDMVEYFGEKLDGFAFTRFGWVQSYGSRCVKPPLIYGDVARPEAMTVDWSRYAQSLTDTPVKGMLTGPVTVLQWSFARDDIPYETVCRQIALALRDEVQDLEKAGIHFIQVDEPAFREGLPLRQRDWDNYLAWAVACFRIATCGVADTTQIHTHMCYSEFNDIIEAIAAMDADAISMETSRSNMELLDAFKGFDYPNGIGPGVYDIHSPRIPSQEEMVDLLDKALEVLTPQQLWVNPDCGLKTRNWDEVEPALAAMVQAARTERSKLDAVKA